MRKLFFRILPLILVFSVAAPPVHAAPLPFSVQQAVVWVHCGNRQGSGVVINADRGYVLTNAHILLNLSTKQPGACEVGFVKDESLRPVIFYDADFYKYVFNEDLNQDFAILVIGNPQGAERVSPFPFLKTDEFSKTRDPISVVAYPSTSKGKQSTTSGVIKGLERGIVKTDAVISPGASGGAGIDASNNLIGIATRILLREVSPGVEEVVDYELVDIRAILTWLDTFTEGFHDQFVTHADAERYHGPMTFFTPGKLNCTILAKSPDASTVFCLHNDGTRSVFPNDATYLSWLAEFSGILTLSTEELANYRLVSNVTMKPGTLIKIQTDPKVYLVSDAKGTLRWIETEARAEALFGNGWAGFVKDVPDTFFINYRVGNSIP